MNGISKLSNNTGASNPNAYMKDAYVYQLGRGSAGQIETTTAVPDAGQGRIATTKANVLRSYRFYDIFPTAVSEIALGYDTRIPLKSSLLNSKFNSLKLLVVLAHLTK